MGTRTDSPSIPTRTNTVHRSVRLVSSAARKGPFARTLTTGCSGSRMLSRLYAATPVKGHRTHRHERDFAHFNENENAQAKSNPSGVSARQNNYYLFKGALRHSSQLGLESSFAHIHRADTQPWALMPGVEEMFRESVVY